MIGAELREIVKRAEVTQKCHLPMFAVTTSTQAPARCWSAFARLPVDMYLVRSYYETRIQAAIQGIANGLYKSIIDS